MRRTHEMSDRPTFVKLTQRCLSIQYCVLDRLKIRLSTYLTELHSACRFNMNAFYAPVLGSSYLNITIKYI
jgi:hypothetical protein